MRRHKLLHFIAPLLILSALACNFSIQATPTVGQIQQEIATQTPETTLESTGIQIQTATAKPESSTISPSTTLPPVTTATSAPVISTATHTPQPPTANQNQPTATIPTSRAAPIAKAYFMYTPPLIDGDWNHLPPLSEAPANFIVFGKENWTGPADLSASFRTAWDENYLYFGIKVNDEWYVQQSSGKDLFKGDSIEILLDTNVRQDYNVQALDADDYQLGISPGKPTPGKNMEAYLFYPSSQAGPLDDVKMAAISNKFTYRVELAIPWALFGIKPSSGTHFGLVISVLDNDTPGTPGLKDMVSSTQQRNLTDPTTWGDLTLSR